MAITTALSTILLMFIVWGQWQSVTGPVILLGVLYPTTDKWIVASKKALGALTKGKITVRAGV
jgi:hypothetical protein